MIGRKERNPLPGGAARPYKSENCSRDMMASESSGRPTEPEAIDALTEERTKTWTGFTTAIAGAVVFVVVVLIGLAVFLL